VRARAWSAGQVFGPSKSANTAMASGIVVGYESRLQVRNGLRMARGPSKREERRQPPATDSDLRQGRVCAGRLPGGHPR
jgi:hypothetical protein